MSWLRPFRRVLSVYRNGVPLVKRKAEVSLLVSAVLVGLFLAELGVQVAHGGLSWALGLRCVVFVVAFALAGSLLAGGRLEAQVNVLAALCVLQCLAFFDGEVSRQFFVLALFSMIVFATLAVRPYQKAIAYLVFPGLVLAKGVVEFVRADRGELTRPTGPETLFTLLVFAGAIPLVNLLMDIVGREMRHNATLVGLTESLKHEAGTDRLTGAWNRRAFERLMRRECAQAQRTGQPLALALIDVDRFKALNDHWGHQAGDQALVEIVKTVSGQLRQGDSLVRWGGDEFVVLCPGVGVTEARALGAKIVGAVADDETLARWDVGVSVGIAIWRAGEPVDTLLSRADSFLYRAKEGGRGQAHAG